MSLSGTNTLKVSAGSGANLNFFMLVPADTDTPTITGVYPDGSTLLQGTNKLSFTVSSASHSIAQSNVVVTLNGVTNNSLVFTGSTSSWNVSAPLALNVTNYTAVITVADNLGNTHSTTVYFDTLNPASYGIEAEDWDFNGGSFIDNPVITSTAAANSYFEKLGHGLWIALREMWLRRLRLISGTARLTPSATDVCGDTRTRAVVAAQQTNALAFSYNIAWWSTNAWANYTHTYPAGTFNVYARVAGGDGLTNQDPVGPVERFDHQTWARSPGWDAATTFSTGSPWEHRSGQAATVTLDGVATLRATSVTGNVNPNSYLLVPLVAGRRAAPVELFGGDPDTDLEQSGLPSAGADEHARRGAYDDLG